MHPAINRLLYILARKSVKSRKASQTTNSPDPRQFSIVKLKMESVDLYEILGSASSLPNSPHAGTSAAGWNEYNGTQLLNASRLIEIGYILEAGIT